MSNSHLKKRRRKDSGKGERKWTKTVWRGINGAGVVSPTGFPYSFPQNVNKGGEKWGKVV